MNLSSYFFAQKSNMIISKQDQLRHENNTWDREIEFFKQEIALLKTRLSMIIDSIDKKEFLKVAEYYQQQFLLKDELINDLKKNINKHNNEIKLHALGIKIRSEVLKKQENLRQQITYFESDFSRLKNEFNQMLTQFL